MGEGTTTLPTDIWANDDVWSWVLTRNNGELTKTKILIEEINFISSVASQPINMAGLKPVLGHTEKPCIVSYYRQFSMNNKIKIMKSLPVYLAQTLGLSGLSNQNQLIFFHFAIRGKLSLIQSEIFEVNLISGWNGRSTINKF